jgi:hypothetical protein
VQVRARRGYRAATVEEATAGGASSEPPSPGAAAFTAAMSNLGRIRPDARFRINAAALPSTGTVWVAGEIPPGAGAAGALSLGATADIDVTAGSASTTTRVQLKPGERTFLTTLKLAGMSGGAVDIRARLTSDGEGSAVDAIRLEGGPATAQPLLFRRGPATANRILPAADLRFSRTERLRLEIPVPPGTRPGAGRLLDKAGNPLGVAVVVSERLDQTSGQQWIVADVTLAPLAPSDYAVEIAFTPPAGDQRIVTAIRVTR